MVGITQTDIDQLCRLNLGNSTTRRGIKSEMLRQWISNLSCMYSLEERSYRSLDNNAINKLDEVNHHVSFHHGSSPTNSSDQTTPCNAVGQ